MQRYCRNRAAWAEHWLADQVESHIKCILADSDFSICLLPNHQLAMFSLSASLFWRVHANYCPKSAPKKRLLFLPWPVSPNSLCLALSNVRVWVEGWMLEECLPYRMTQCPTAFAPCLAHSEGMLLMGAVSHVTKAPFYTTGVQIMVRAQWLSLVWLQPLIVEFQTSPSATSKHPYWWRCSLPKPGRDIRESSSWRCLQETAREDK